MTDDCMCQDYSLQSSLYVTLPTGDVSTESGWAYAQSSAANHPHLAFNQPRDQGFLAQDFLSSINSHGQTTYYSTVA